MGDEWLGLHTCRHRERGPHWCEQNLSNHASVSCYSCQLGDKCDAMCDVMCDVMWDTMCDAICDAMCNTMCDTTCDIQKSDIIGG